jgi:hypothetical protein
MIVIAAYWIFLFFLFLTGGLLAKKILGVTAQNTILTLLLGIVLYTVGFTITAFFFPLGVASLAVWSGVGIVSALIFKDDFKASVKNLITSLKNLPRHLKIVLGMLTAALLLKSAQSPFITDNEGYYIQTIKWLNEYGFVKGLANLHLLFGQTSLWHVLQAGVNFSFITNRINDISGFTFLLCLIYFFTEGHKRSVNSNLNWLLFIPVFFILLIQFADAPSPDLPLYLILPIVLDLWLHDTTGSSFKTAFVLFVYLGLVKMTCLPMGLIFISAFAEGKKLRYMLGICLPMIALWIAKNIIISGYPLFPLPFLRLDAQWAMNADVYQFIMRVTSDNGYVRQGFLPEDISFITKLTYWIGQGGIYTIINAATVLLLVLTPFTTYACRNKAYRLIYAALLINFMLVLSTSPQFRYFLHITILCGLFCLADAYNWLKPKLAVYKTIALGATALMFVVFFNVSLTASKSKMNKSTGQTRLSQIYLPERNTKYPEMEYKKVNMGNLEYYSPIKALYLYGSHDGPLPCVNERMLRSIERQFGVVSQLIGTDLGDGFYSAPAQKN